MRAPCQYCDLLRASTHFLPERTAINQVRAGLAASRRPSAGGYGARLGRSVLESWRAVLQEANDESKNADCVVNRAKTIGFAADTNNAV